MVLNFVQIIQHTKSFPGVQTTKYQSICMVCSKLEHAKCPGIQTLEEVIKNTNSKSELKSLKHRVEETRNIFKRLVKDRNQNIEMLEDQKEVLRTDVQTFKERIYQHLERLEHKLSKEID